FQIGRIEGVWKNFLPPIQGGKVRPFQEEASFVDDDSSQSSQPPSPVFDAVDANSGLRRRKSTSTDTSVSTPPNEEFEPKPFFLDARTQEEIVLDVAKYPSLEIANQE